MIGVFEIGSSVPNIGRKVLALLNFYRFFCSKCFRKFVSYLMCRETTFFFYMQWLPRSFLQWCYPNRVVHCFRTSSVYCWMPRATTKTSLLERQVLGILLLYPVMRYRISLSRWWSARDFGCFSEVGSCSFYWPAKPPCRFASRSSTNSLVIGVVLAKRMRRFVLMLNHFYLSNSGNRHWCSLI